MKIHLHIDDEGRHVASPLTASDIPAHEHSQYAQDGHKHWTEEISTTPAKDIFTQNLATAEKNELLIDTLKRIDQLELNPPHQHNDLYYTEAEIDSKLIGKADKVHSHNDLYYTEAEIDSKLTAKSDITHSHNGYALDSHTHTQYAPVVHNHSGTDINLSTTNFNKNLTSTDNTVQKALDKLDDLATLRYVRNTKTIPTSSSVQQYSSFWTFSELGITAQTIILSATCSVRKGTETSYMFPDTYRVVVGNSDVSVAMTSYDTTGNVYILAIPANSPAHHLTLNLIIA